MWTVWTLDKADRVFSLVASPDIPGLGLDRPQPSWDPAWCPSVSTGCFWVEITHAGKWCACTWILCCRFYPERPLYVRFVITLFVWAVSLGQKWTKDDGMGVLKTPKFGWHNLWTAPTLKCQSFILGKRMDHKSYRMSSLVPSTQVVNDESFLDGKSIEEMNHWLWKYDVSSTPFANLILTNIVPRFLCQLPRVDSEPNCARYKVGYCGKPLQREICSCSSLPHRELYAGILAYLYEDHSLIHWYPVVQNWQYSCRRRVLKGADSRKRLLWMAKAIYYLSGMRGDLQSYK